MFKKQNYQGMSYVEVAICLFIVSLSIMPLARSFVSSVRVKETAASTQQTTLYAETLLEETKAQLTKNLLSDKKIENNYVATSNYLITDFLGIEDTEVDVFNQKYQTDRYSYEFAIWKINEVEEVSGQVKITSDRLAKAYKFYTDTSYQFSTGDLGRLPQFTLDESQKGLFKDELFLSHFLIGLNPDDSRRSSIVGIRELKLDMEEDKKLSDTDIIENESDNIDIQRVQKSDTLRIYNIALKEGYTLPHRQPNDPLPFAVLVVDTRALELDEELPKTVLKFNNQTTIPLSLKILMNPEREPEEDEEEEDIIRLEDKLILMVSDSGAYKTSIEKIIQLDQEDDYLIVVIVRDKNPRLGAPGKIVKTMVDLYTFEY